MADTFLQRLFTAILLCIAAQLGGVATAADDDELARTILKKADQIRFPNEGFQVEVSINTAAPGQTAEIRKYRILSKGNENTIVMITEPAADRGQIMLMKGRDLWIYLPSVTQPVRLGLSQRLTGQVANGDLARANFSGRLHAEDSAQRHHRRREIPRSGAHRGGSQRHLSQGHLLGEGIQSLTSSCGVLLAIQPPAQDLPLREFSDHARNHATDPAGHGRRAAQG